MVVSNRADKVPKKSFLNRILAKLESNKAKKDALLPYSIASDDSSEIAFSDTTYFQTATGKKLLEIMYRNNWAVFKAVNVRANLMSIRGLKIKAKSDKAIKVTNDFLKRMHPTRPMVSLVNSFKNRSINTDVFGNGHDELLYDPSGTKEKPLNPSKAKNMLGFTAVHPINIDYQREANGNRILFDKHNMPKGWIWNRDPTDEMSEGIKIPLGRITHMKYNTIGDELFGMSSIEPVYKTAERHLKVEEGVTHAILTYGNPTRDFTVGDETHVPTKPMIDGVAEEVLDFNFKSEYVHPPWVKVNQIESFSLGNATDYTKPYLTAISAATSVPEFILLGRGEGTNKATAQAMIEFIHQTVEPLQQTQAMYFEEQILAPLMKLNGIEEIPIIEWNEILPKSLTDYANVIKTLSEAMVGGKQIITFEEAREIAGLEKGKSTKDMNSTLAEKKFTPGINILNAEKIWSKEKQMVIFNQDMSQITNTALMLLSGNNAYGVIKIKPGKKISLLEFKNLKDKHLISEKERLRHWPNSNVFIAHEFTRLQMFEEPVTIKTDIKGKVYVENVEI